MKKTVLVALLIIAFCFATPLLAQSSGKSSIGIGAGYRSRTINLEPTVFTPDVPALANLDEDFTKMDIKADYQIPLFSVHLNFLNYVDLAFLLGSIDYDLDHKSEKEGFSQNYTVNSELAFGFGGRIMYPVMDKYLVGIYFAHLGGTFDNVELSSPPPELSFRLPEEYGGFEIPIESITPENLKFSETTVTPVVGMTFGRFTPYIGPRYSKVTTELKTVYEILGEDNDRQIRYEATQTWSAVFGVTAQISDDIFLTAELDTLDDNTYMVEVQYNF